MTAVLSGTNGLLQAYDYQVLTTAFTYTFAAGTQVLVINPAGTLATGTITMPASPSDGMTITFSSSQQITALTLSGNTGQSVVSAVTFLPAKTGVSYVYRLANTTWYPTVTVPGTGSQLVQSALQTPTGVAVVDFTSIPSWVKRITVILQGLSNGAGADFYLRLGTGATPTYAITGYLGVRSVITNGASGDTAALTTGWDISVQTGGGGFANGHAVITNISGNIWVCSAVTAATTDNKVTIQAGNITLGAALTAVRITAANGTDNFDAGSINILYE
jgi:hypothetical protein